MHVLILDQWKSCVQEASINVIGEGARGCCEVNRVAWVQSADWEGERSWYIARAARLL